MTVETALYPNQLNASWPLQSDIVREGAGHLRLLKSVLKTTFPNVTGAVSASHIELSRVSGLASPVQPQLDALATGKGSVSGQTWTGTHVFPSTTTVGPLTPTIQTWLAGVTSDVQTQINDRGVTAGQTWTGTHDFTGASLSVPTLPAGNSSSAAASTAFVSATAFSAALPGQTGNAGKYITTDGTNASWAYPFLSAVPVTGTSATATVGAMNCLQNAAASTLTLPPNPADGDVVGVKAENLRTDNTIARNGNPLMGLNEDMTIDNPYYPIVLQFRTTYGWRLVA